MRGFVVRESETTLGAIVVIGHLAEDNRYLSATWGLRPRGGGRRRCSHRSTGPTFESATNPSPSTRFLALAATVIVGCNAPLHRCNSAV
jgi:hypothetical protein